MNVRRTIAEYSRTLLLSICCLTSTHLSAEELRVYAASSFANVLEEIVTNFQLENAADVTPVFGSSSSLARQIVRGAPASIFISANSLWMDYAVAQGAAKGDGVTNVASNQLVLVSADKNIELDITNSNQWKEILASERLAIGQPESVPAGIYAKQTLENLNLWDGVKDRIAPTKNVRLALALAERREVPLAIVYYTDALQSEQVTIQHYFDERLHRPIAYPAAVIQPSLTADKFMVYLRSDEARAIFKKHGFGTP